MYIEGRLRVEEWTDRDGKARHTLEVNATDMQFIGGGGGPGGGGGAGAGARSEEPMAERSAPPETGSGPGDFQDDDVPF